MAAEVGHLRLALDYVVEAASLDLQDLEHNTRDGLHIVALAGTWIGLTAGFGGMRDWSSPGLVDIPGSVIRARGVIHGKTQAT